MHNIVLSTNIMGSYNYRNSSLAFLNVGDINMNTGMIFFFFFFFNYLTDFSYFPFEKKIITKVAGLCQFRSKTDLSERDGFS